MHCNHLLILILKEFEFTILRSNLKNLIDFKTKARKSEGHARISEERARSAKRARSFKMTSKDALSIDTDVKPPVLFKGEYEQWKNRFLDFVDRHTNGENILLSIMEGPMVPITVQIPDDDSSDSEDGTEEREQKDENSSSGVQSIFRGTEKPI
ncbi:hypothetical protein L6452_06297 [Arctium lappa]|uniref:Uncharacterized protein n=1 Tax=Arctium lappa TaxID=4217 RepID=A0ACB9EJU8_ARCLA|nr:hypothetical protein L6452_06297 [Arctium lappa]